MENLSGRWEGLMIDAAGHRGNVLMDLEQRGEELQGKIQFTLQDHHPQEPLTTEIAGKVDAKGQTQLRYAAKGAPTGPVEVQFQAQQAAAMPHAKRALYGTFAVQSEGPSPLSEGVAIFWLFAGQR